MVKVINIPIDDEVHQKLFFIKKEASVTSWLVNKINEEYDLLTNKEESEKTEQEQKENNFEG